MRRELRALGGIWASLLSFACSTPPAPAAPADSPSTASESYTEKLKRKLEKEDAEKAKAASAPVVTVPGGVPDPYLQSIRSKLDADKPPTTESYTESLKRKDPDRYGTSSEKSYTEQEARKLGPKPEGGAIAAVKEGRSELSFKKKGEISAAFGFRYGASISRDLTASDQANRFADIYGTNYAPDLSLFYEYQLIHSEIFGSLGLLGSVGGSYSHGPGRFAIQLANYSLDSNTNFQFIAVPVVLGPSYRLNLTRFLIPYATAGPSLIPYFEPRNDEKSGFHGMSKAFYFAGGVMIPLDWVSQSASADFYYGYGVQRYSLTVEYMKFSTFSGDVRYNTSGVNIGFLFEY